MQAVVEDEPRAVPRTQAPLGSVLYNVMARNELSDSEFESLIAGISGDSNATEEFRALIHRDSRLESAVVYAIRERPPSVIEAVLALLSRCDGGCRALTALLPYTLAADARIRSLAAMLVARRCPNIDWVRSALRHPDPRVRANVLEAAPASMLDPEILELGLHDRHHRVAGTAALRLLEFDEKRGLAALRALTQDERVPFRAAGVWAVGESRRAGLLNLADALRHDPAPEVRWGARRAMIRLRQSDPI